MMDTSGSVKVVIFDMDDGWVELHMEDWPGGLVGREREPTDLRAGLIAKCKKKQENLAIVARAEGSGQSSQKSDDFLLLSSFLTEEAIFSALLTGLPIPSLLFGIPVPSPA